MAHTDVSSIETAYQAAVSSEGKVRLERFTEFAREADRFSRERIYAEEASKSRFGLAYANLMHNFLGSLADLKMMDAHREILMNLEKYGPEKYAVAEAWSDGVLIRNGQSTVELLYQVDEAHFGNGQVAPHADQIVESR